MMVKRIPKWSDPRSGSICHSLILLVRVLVVKAKSRTLGLARLGRKKVPSPGVLTSSSSWSSNHSTSWSAPWVGFASGSHHGW